MDNNNLPSNDLFIDFWKTKYSEFREKWNGFNNKFAVPQGRWETAIAIMPNDENAQRYNFLNIKEKPGRKISINDLGRNFGEISFFQYCKQNNFSLKDEYTEGDVNAIYEELCEVEFPEKSFSDPAKFRYDMELTFEEYKTTHGDMNPVATIKEHIVFPYDFVTTYPIPLFQPQASIYFMTRIRDAKKYTASIMPDSLTPEETILLNGTYGSKGINSFLNDFLTSAEFREWERMVNAELSVLRYIAFIRDLRYLLDKGWTMALSRSLRSLIRGKIEICNEIATYHEKSRAGDNQKLLCSKTSCPHSDLPMEKNYFAINLMDSIGKVFVVNTSVGWNKITEGRKALLDRYMDLVSEVVRLMRSIQDKEDYRACAETYESIRPHVDVLLQHLTHAERAAARVRSVVQHPAVAIIGAGSSAERFFKTPKEPLLLGGRTLFTCHDWEDTNNSLELVGASILTVLGLEDTVDATLTLWQYAQRVLGHPSQLCMALNKAILADAVGNEEIFVRAVNCFHSPHKAGMFIPASLIVACFPSTYEDLKGHMTKRFTFKYGNNTPDKLNYIFQLLKPFGENYSVKITPPCTDGRRTTPGNMMINTTSSAQNKDAIDCNQWTDLYNTYLESTEPTKSGWVGKISAYFGKDNKDLKCDEGKIYVINNPKECLTLLKDKVEIQFIINVV
jgi:hypothetical protein